MSKKLKEFLKEAPGSGEAKAVWTEMIHDSPRSIGITASAWIEDLLRDALEVHFRVLDTKEMDSLFEGTAPLATFSARIQIAYGLAIFGKKTRHDLDTIRTIRNAFAHSRRAITFETPAVANLVGGLHAANDIVDRAEHDTKTIYITCCRIMLVHLITKIEQSRGETPSAVDGVSQLD